jgi:hypothetical protein
VEANSQVFKDPCPGKSKYLEIQYSCDDIYLPRTVGLCFDFNFKRLTYLKKLATRTGTFLRQRSTRKIVNDVSRFFLTSKIS